MNGFVCFVQGVVELQRDGDRRRSRESLSSVKYESASEAGEDGSVDWNGVSALHRHAHLRLRFIYLLLFRKA